MKFKSDIEVQAGLKDSSGSSGASGQILSSTNGNVSWVTPTVNTVARDVQNQVKAGVAINKGQAVYVTGADGTNIIVGLASNTTEATSSKTLGLLNATVAVNGFADVVQIGRLAGFDTSTATIGDPVWLGTNGNLIYGLTNKPYAPAHLVFIGVVTRVNANNGEIFVTVQNGFELKEIHDVDLVTTVPVNGEVLGYNGTLWVNKTVAGWLGYTPVPTTRTLTINGTTQDLSANRTFSVDVGVTSFNTRTGAVTLTSGDVTTALGYTPVTNARTLTINGVTYDLSANRSWTITAPETDTLETVTARGNTTTNGLIATANEGREVGTYLPSTYGANDLVSGHYYKWYSDIWRLGATRSGGAAAADFVVQLNGVNKLNLTIGGSLSVPGDMRASIFYDLDNTAYYVNPGGYSYMSSIEANSYVRTRNFYADGNTYVLNAAGNGWNTVIDRNGGTNWIVYGGASMRAPIFYDSNDTGFYLDPNSTTTSLVVAGAIKQNNTLARPSVQWGQSGNVTGALVIKLPGTSPGNYGMIHAVIDVYEYNSNNVCTIIIGGHNWSSQWYNYGADVVGNTNKQVRLGIKDGRYCIVLGDGSSTWEYGQVVLRKIQNGTYYSGVMDLGGAYSIGIESDTYSWISGNLNVFSSTNVIATSAAYAPIYYDNNNTGYYVDPASTSNFNAANFAGSVNLFGGYGPGSGPGLSFENQGTFARIVFWGLDFYDWNNGTQMVINDGYVLANNSMRSPIFYDSDNTGYYGDFASTSNFNKLLLNSQNTFNAATPGLTSYGLTFMGGIADYANGITWTWGNTNAQAGVYVQSSGSYGTKMYFATTDSFATGSKTGMSMDHNGTVLVTRSYLQSDSSLRAPIFYDSNNTAYYTDPGSTSNLNNLAVTGSFSGANNVVYGDGSVGKSTYLSSMNELTNQPSGFYFYPAPTGSPVSDWFNWMTVRGNSWAGPGDGYGYQLACNFWSDDLYLRRVQGGAWQNWRLMLHSNNYQGYSTFSGAVYGTIFYDANNTGYYVDPAGSSNVSTLTADSQGIFIKNNTYYCTTYAGAGNLQPYSTGNYSAYISFHKAGNYGLNMGLDADNVLRIGGFSAASNRFQMDMSGNLTMAGDVTAYSDRRVKENIITVDNALEKVNNLRGVYYNRIDSEDKRTKLGVIAQEILEIVPEVVSQDNDGMYNVSYGNLAGLFIEAIKEQQTQIEELKQLVNKLINK